jgi:hypothetical protein
MLGALVTQTYMKFHKAHGVVLLHGLLTFEHKQRRGFGGMVLIVSII